MKATTILVTGAILSLTAFGESHDPFAEERFRMKTGRYTPAEEARKTTRKNANAKAAYAEAPTCCRNMNESFKNPKADPASVEARFQIKYGRSTPAAEAHQRKALAETAMHIQKCVELGQCTLMSVKKTAAKNSTAAAADPERDTLFRAKFGGGFPVQSW